MTKSGVTCAKKGITWEMLSPDMDVEEPEAALVVSIALNKTNEASMNTARTEIMTTLVPSASRHQVPGRCASSQSGRVWWSCMGPQLTTQTSAKRFNSCSMQVGMAAPHERPPVVL